MMASVNIKLTKQWLVKIKTKIVNMKINDSKFHSS